MLAVSQSEIMLHFAPKFCYVYVQLGPACKH